jgi:transcriptional regulator with XRE-family HTH domain
MLIGERLKIARESAKISQSALARATKITPSAISQLELGMTKKPSASNLLPLAKALNVDPNWLITGKGDMRPPMQVKEPAAAYHIPWPDAPEQINMALVADIADKVAKSTGVDISLVQREIAAAILEHYKNRENV